jgi:hypothetical protein
VNILLEHERVVLFHGDSKNLSLASASVDAIVTDPPAGIDFMGKGWDSDKGGRDKWIAWLADTLKPSFEALKPGGHALVWALPRTSHWTAMALELAGFEIRDIVMHLFGTGFPKSLTSKSADIPEGTGSALKPAAEHWILARKPLEGTYGENYAKYGTGVLNIDACRIGYASESDRAQTIVPQPDFKHVNGISTHLDAHARNGQVFDPGTGRWPANVTLDEDAAQTLDERGSRPSGGRKGKAGKNLGYHGGASGYEAKTVEPSDGGPSRFFYVAKAPRKEKDAGLDHLQPKTGGQATDRTDDSAGVNNPRAGAGRTGGARNFHPTVKNLALMRWLCRLITPPGGTVLDPFAGSGSTGVAAIEEGFNFVGCEQGGKDNEYLPILLGRINHAIGQE